MSYERKPNEFFKPPKQRVFDLCGNVGTRLSLQVFLNLAKIA